ncbi:MAG TPA: hypothetical protein EYP34_01925, partial [Chromatiaceae bacterium]|nr:hypothetical protein [Chromatiaceae bacterium]
EATEEAESELPEIETSGIVLQMDEIDPEIFDIFMEEAGEELKVIGSQYPLWKEDHTNEQALQNFRRSFHTLKGSGRMVGAHIIGELSWAVENLLNRIMEGSVKPDEEVIAYLDDVMAAVPVLVKAQGEGGAVNIDVPKLEARGFALAERSEQPEEVVESVSEALFDSEFAGLEEPLSEELEQESELAEEGESVREHSSILLADDLVEIFKAESATHLAVLDSFMADCDQCIVDADVVRAVHTLHGSSHLAEVAPMATLAGEMEHYCKHMHQLSHPVGGPALELFRRFRDTMQQMLDAINSPDVEIEGWESLAELIREQDHALPDVISELQAGGDTETLSDLTPDHETQEVFLEEAGEILPQLAEHLMSWQEKPLPETGEKIRRDLHTLKGGARLAGFASLGDVLHGMEGFFDALLETGGEVDAGTSSRVVEVLEDVESALDMLHLNGKLPDLSAQIKIAADLAQGMQQLTSESEQSVETDSVLATEHLNEEPESILLSESWSEEGEFVPEAPVQEIAQSEPNLTMPDVDPEMLEIFLEEAGEISEHLEEFYGQWIEDLTAHSSIDGLMRNLHTLKGNARFAGLFSL